jgi:hypothetical protein
MNRLIRFLIRGRKKLTEEQRFVEDLGIQQAIAQFHENMDSIDQTLDEMEQSSGVLFGKAVNFEEKVEELVKVATVQEAQVRQRMLEEGLLSPLPIEPVAQRKHQGL